MVQTPLFNLLPLTWQFFSAIATFLAVVAAALFPVWRDRRRVAVGAHISIGKRTKALELFVTVTNEGRNGIWITRLRCRYKRQYRKGKGFITIQPDTSSLPIHVKPMEQVGMSSRAWMAEIPKIKHLSVVDSLGKSWKVRRSGMQHLQARYDETLTAQKRSRREPRDRPPGKRGRTGRQSSRG